MHKYQLSDRLKAVRGNQTLTEFGGRFGTSRQVIKHYEDGDRRPDSEMLYRIADTLGISADYLLGLDDVQSVDKDIKIAVRCTGLNESAIKNLKDYIDLERERYGDMPISATLSGIIATKAFLWMASNIRSACVSGPNENPDILGIEFIDNGAAESVSVRPRAYFKYAATLKFQELMDDLIEAYDEEKGWKK